LHPIRRWSCEWIEKEHEQDTGVDADVEVSHSTNAANVGAVVGTDGFVLRRESLEIPTAANQFMFIEVNVNSKTYQLGAE